MSTAPASGTADRARAFWIVSPGRGEIRDVPIEAVPSGHVLIQSVYSGISRGTELLIFNGRVPVSEHQRMRAPFQDGDFPGPVKYGYINVGVVEQGPPPLVGQRVFSLYPHQSRFVIPADAAHVLPEGVPSERAVLAANLETAINGVWDAAPQPGDRIVVIGAGVVGCLVGWLMSRIPGVSCVLTDVNPRRSVTARALGVRFADPSVVEGEADVVVHTSGSPPGLARALELAGSDAVIVDMSWYGDQIVPLPLGAAFHSRRLTIKSSQVGAIPPSHRHRWTFDRRLQLALTVLEDPVLEALITGESAFDDLPEVMKMLASGDLDALCHRIRY